MKHIKLTGFAILTSIFWSFYLTSLAQQYQPLPDSNATWIVNEYCSEYNSWDKLYILPNSPDTMINNIIYTKLYYESVVYFRDNKNPDQSCNSKLTTVIGLNEKNEVQHEKIRNFYIGAYRSDNEGRSYFFPPYLSAPQEEVLLSDLTVNAGDTVKDVALHLMIDGFELVDFKVDSVGSRVNGPYELKYLYLSPAEDLPHYWGSPLIWIEGIGSLNGGVLNSVECGSNFRALECMSVFDTLFYSTENPDCSFHFGFELVYEPGICELPVVVDEISYDESIIVLPNPFTEKFEIRNLSNGENSILIFDNLGNVVYDNRLITYENISISINCNLKPGLYFLIINQKNNKLWKQKIMMY